jgi:hypothetical protein
MCWRGFHYLYRSMRYLQELPKCYKNTATIFRVSYLLHGQEEETKKLMWHPIRKSSLVCVSWEWVWKHTIDSDFFYTFDNDAYKIHLESKVSKPCKKLFLSLPITLVALIIIAVRNKSCLRTKKEKRERGKNGHRGGHCNYHHTKYFP